jgi:hypothetical protein
VKHTTLKKASAQMNFANPFVMKKEFIKYIGSFLDWNVLRIEIFS